MYADVKKTWSAALRSDRFKQGRGNLKMLVDGEWQHCCLGVLCDLAVEAGVAVEEKMSSTGIVSFDGERSFLPWSVADWAGLNTTSPTVVDGAEPDRDLVALNDGLSLTVEPHSFPEIADLIDTMPEEVRPG